MAPVADPVTAPAAEPLAPEPHRVVARAVETPDVVSLTLVPVGSPLEPVRPGQFVMVWAFGVGEVPISVSGVGAAGEIRLTVRSVGAVSAAITRGRPGDLFGVRGPYGTSWPVHEAAGRDAAVVAGGLGLAPLRLAVDALIGTAARLTVVVGAREPAQVLYPGDLDRWSAAGVAVARTVDRADRAWTASVGTATAELNRLGSAHDVAFVCGPELMMTSAARALIDLGTPPSRLHVSLERNMHCGIAHCGRCQLGPLLLCRDGAVVRWDRVATLLEVRGR